MRIFLSFNLFSVTILNAATVADFVKQFFTTKDTKFYIFIRGPSCASW